MSKEAYIAMKNSLPRDTKATFKLAFIRAYDKKVVEKAWLGMFGDVHSDLNNISIFN